MNSAFRNWSDIRVFLAVMRQGSTLAASQKLGVAQPTVARRIDALEHELKLSLFERDTRGFHPTAAAKTLLPLAEALEAAATGLETAVRGLTRARAIRITAYSANFSQRVSQIFSEFSIENPDVQFEFLPGIMPLDLMAGEADIALRLTRTPPHPDLICRKISTAEFTLYGSPEYATKYGLPRSSDDLAGHKFVTFRREGLPSALHDWIAARVRPEQIVSTFSEVDTTIAAVRAGVGLSLDNVRRAAGDPKLIQCFPAEPDMTSEHLMLISPEAYRRPEVRKFTKFFAPRYAAIFRD